MAPCAGAIGCISVALRESECLGLEQRIDDAGVLSRASRVDCQWAKNCANTRQKVVRS